MTDLEVSIACLPGLHTADLLDGSAHVDGLAYTATRMGSADQVTRAMLQGQFDVGEMSIGTYVKALEQGAPLIALPIFTGRKFLQPYIFTSPEFAAGGDLGSARFGVAQYWMSASIWQRWLLASEHGVDLTAVSWVPTSRDRVEDAPIPEQFRVSREGMGLTAQELFEKGLIDVFLSGRTEKGGLPRLHDDTVTASSRFFDERGFIPIMHVVTVRTDRAVHDPEAVHRLISLWSSARDSAFASAGKDAALVFPFAEAQLAETRGRLGRTWNEYGLTAENTRALTTFFQAAADQGLTKSCATVADAVWGASGSVDGESSTT